MMQNGHGHGMVPAAAAATAAVVARPLPEICFILRRKVLAFLEQNPCALSSDGHGAIRSVQMQTRASIEVVQEALRRYGYGNEALFLPCELSHQAIITIES